MTKIPAWRQALKDHGRQRSTNIEDIPMMVNDLMAESDRSAAILIATQVEDALEAELIRRMPGLKATSADYNAMFGAEAPLGTFSAKTRAAYAMGVLDETAAKQVGLIRDIRNTCAHSRYPTSFQTPAVAEACEHLFADMTTVSEKKPTLRDLFIMKCMLITDYITTGKWRMTSADILDIIGETDEQQTSPDTLPPQ